MSVLSQPQAKGLLCWDIDGILIGHADAAHDWRAELSAEALALYTEFEGSDRRWRDCLRGERNVGEALAEKAVEMAIPEQEVRQVLRVWHGRNTAFHHTALEWVHAMKRAGWRTAIASNQDKDRAAVLRHVLRLEEVVDIWGFSCNLGVAKPDGAFYEKVKALSGIDEALPCIMMDDRVDNLEAPRQLGWQTHHYTGMAGLEDFLRRL